MPQVILNVNGNPYQLACNEGEEDQLQALGGVISDKVQDIVQAMGHIGDAKLILMAALLLLDEAKSITAQSSQLAQNSQANADAIKAAAAKIENIADQIETA